VRLLEQLGAALEAAKAGADPRTQVELALVKAARPEVDGSLPALLARLERLERGAALVRVDVAPEQDPAAATPAEPAHAVDAGVVAAAPAEHEDAAAPAEHEDAAAPAEHEEAAAEHKEAPAEHKEAPAEHKEAPAEHKDLEPAARAHAYARGGPSGDTADLDALVALWPAVLELVGTKNALLSAVLAHARPVAVRDGELRVAFAATASFPKKKAEDREHRATVTEALRELTGDARMRVEYELRDELPASEEREPVPRTEEEWVARFKEELDAEELPAERVLAGGAGEPPNETASGG
jgi:DNA polymerase-3 subunit gamma/tau